jgi:hypothetical protein
MAKRIGSLGQMLAERLRLANSTWATVAGADLIGGQVIAAVGDAHLGLEGG